jgi:hypothetical protein
LAPGNYDLPLQMLVAVLLLKPTTITEPNDIIISTDLQKNTLVLIKQMVQQNHTGT